MNKNTFTCQHCGKVFQTKYQTAKYCSRECYEAVRATKPKKQTFTCEYCGKSFDAYQYDYQSPRQFCSKPCHYAAHQGVNNPKFTSILMNCDHCSKSFYQKPFLVREKKGNFCSRKCAAQHTSKDVAALRKTGKMVSCLNCGKEVYKIPTHTFDIVGNFCSIACLGEYRARTRVTITCAYCGQKRRVKASHGNKGARYCSVDCTRKGTAPTTLELLGYQLLEVMEFEYIKQHRIGKFIVDAYIPSLNLVVQFDGDYWHNQESAKQRDARHAKYMTERGIPFVRIRESELKKDYNVLRDRIIHTCELLPSQVPVIPTSFVPQLSLDVVQPSLLDLPIFP